MSILSGLARGFKSLVKSPSKFLLTAAAVYVGGSAMGWWDSPFESINGAWAGGAVDAGGAATSGLAGGESSALQSAQGADPGATFAQSLINQGGSSGASDVVANALSENASAMPAGNMPMADGGAMDMGIGTAELRNQTFAGKQPGIVSAVAGKAMGFLDGVGDFVKKNPAAAMIGGNALASAFQPNQVDVLERKYELDRQESERRRQIANSNMAVGNVRLGAAPPIISSLRGA